MYNQTVSLNELHRPGRREAVRKFAVITTGMALSPLITACLPDGGERSVGKERRKEKKEPTLGDVITSNGNAFLLNGDGRRYPLRGGELDTYTTASKLREYNRGVFPVSREFAEKYPVGQRSGEGILVSQSTLLSVENHMGEVVVPWMGMLTSGNDSSSEIRPLSFPQITQALMLRGWRDPQNLLFSYGSKPVGKSVEQAIRDGGFGYTIFDTLRPLRDISADAITHIKYVQEILPYCQQNHLMHSLGGVGGMEAIMRHPSSTNCVVIVSSPVRGMPKDLVRSKLFDFARNIASQYKGAEKIVGGALALINDLLALWENKEHQRRLDEFTLSFVESGKKLIVVIDENDPIVPEESSRLKGATEVRIKNKMGLNLLELLPKIFGPQQELVEYALTLVDAHGNGLRDPKAIQTIRETFGNNLSFPIGTVTQNPPRFPQLQPDFK